MTIRIILKIGADASPKPAREQSFFGFGPDWAEFLLIAEMTRSKQPKRDEPCAPLPDKIQQKAA